MAALHERQYWMSVLAHSRYSELLSRWQALSIEQDYILIRKPEIGLAQIRARMGSTGNEFNIGDATITRAVVKLEEGELGYSYLQGRNKPHAELAALIDALMQTAKYAEHLHKQLIAPLAKIKTERESHRANEIAASKVDFFTLLRGED